MRLYNERNERLYLNQSEVRRFLQAAKKRPLRERFFALTLAHTGLRISEALSLTAESFQLEERVLSVRTLKRRKFVMREVPLPEVFIPECSPYVRGGSGLLWQEHGRPIRRITAYRWIKGIMVEAEIDGAKACPKGLRHAFGVRAVLASIPLHMIQLWMGHASMKTTAIYATVLGKEQLELADRMW